MVSGGSSVLFEEAQASRLGLEPAAHKLVTPTQPSVQTQETPMRWLLQVLPWVQILGSTYRVSRRPGAKEQTAPREYPLSVLQTVLQVHTRVADLFTQPMNQTERQLRRTIEALKERQEHALLNHRDFGLLHQVNPAQRLSACGGLPTPAALDELLTMVPQEQRFFLAHPRTLLALAKECGRRGIALDSMELRGELVPAWRGVPVLPCDKLPISAQGTSSIMLLRVGEKSQGVIGLQQAGLRDELEPSLSVRFLSINERAIISYLVSLYYSAAVLAADALAMVEDVEVGP